MDKSNQYLFNSVSDLHAAMNLKKPTNPLISVVRLEDISPDASKDVQTIVFNFYALFLKIDFDGRVKYGHQYYDFDSGTMSFYAPGQLITLETNQTGKLEGWMLVIHPDFLHGYPIAKQIKEYGYFDYATHEALHISETEKTVVSGLMQSMQEEIKERIDNYTQGILIGQADLLLSYCNRFYSRQFITRKKVSSDLLMRFEAILKEYYKSDKLTTCGLPSVQYFADQLLVSTNYLNDMLKSLTGQTTQQHLHSYLIERAKELLATTALSVSEIAFLLGFEYAQSFNKLFKKKTLLTPLQFRQLFN